MDQFNMDHIRNVVVLGHSGAGKTSLVEAMLFTAQAISRKGSIEEGTTVSDYEPEEHRRQASLHLSVMPLVWKDTKINLLDTPGYADFVGETISALRVADAALLVISGPSGVEVGAEQAWRRARDLSLPTIVFINKLDREGADFAAVLARIRTELGRECVAVNLPTGPEASLSGVVSLLSSDLDADAMALQEQLTEAVAETDDTLTERYLEEAQLSSRELSEGLRHGVRSATLVPVAAGSATTGVGAAELLDAIIQYLPSPAEAPPPRAKGEEVAVDPSGPLTALVFKTTADPFVGKLSYFRVYQGTLSANSEVWNATTHTGERVGQVFVPLGKGQESVGSLVAGDIGAVPKLASTTTGQTLCHRSSPVTLDGIEFPAPTYSVAASPKTKADLEKMSTALTRLNEEDPSLIMVRDSSTGELVIRGMGDVHIEVTAERARRKFGIELELTAPRIPYRETITRVANVEYKHKKQTGGHGQYGHVFLRLEPQQRGEGFSFGSEVVGGNVPKEYIAAVEKGVTRALEEGTGSGFPIVDVRVILYDGSSHSVDSSGASFEIAGSMAMKKGVAQATPVLLEPIMRVTLLVPDASAGDVIGDLNARRSRILGISPAEGIATIEADIPQAEVQQWATSLRALTQGRGSMSIAFGHYGEVPAHVAQRLTSEASTLV